MSEEKKERWVSRSAAAKELQISWDVFNRMIMDGDIPKGTIRKVGKSIKLEMNEIIRVVDAEGEKLRGCKNAGADSGDAL